MQATGLESENTGLKMRQISFCAKLLTLLFLSFRISEPGLCATLMALNKLEFSCFFKAKLTSLDLRTRWNTITEPISSVLEKRGACSLETEAAYAVGGGGRDVTALSGTQACTRKSAQPHTHNHPSLSHTSTNQHFYHSRTHCSLC